MDNVQCTKQLIPHSIDEESTGNIFGIYDKLLFSDEVVISNTVLCASSKSGTTLTTKYFLLSKCAPKKIVHLGCCGHLSSIKASIEKSTWLHGKLGDVAEKCIGIDIDQSVIDLVKSFGCNDI